MAENKPLNLSAESQGGSQATLGESAAPRPATGALLVDARKRKGLSVADAANSLRIRQVYLEAIEEGRLSDLPGAAYALGFVRTYAEYLGLDGNEIVRRFKDEADELGRKTELVFPLPLSEGRFPGRILILVSIGLALFIYGVWHFTASRDRSMVELVPPPPAATKSVATPPAEPAKPAETTAAEPPKPAESAKPAEPAAPTASVAVAVPPPPAPTPTPAPSPAPSAAASPAPAATPASGQPLPAATPSAPAPMISASNAPAAGSPPPAAAKPDATPAPATSAPAAATPAPAASAPVAANPPPATAPNPPPSSATANPPPSSAAAPQANPPPPAVAAAGAAAGATSAQQPAQTASSDAAPKVFGDESGSARIQLKAKSETWIQVTDENGKVVAMRTLKPGESYRVPNKAGLTLFTGNAGGLDVTVDGKKAPALGPSGMVRRSVALEPDGLLAGE